MPIALAFFVHYAYLILFLWVLVEQIGIPIPSIPVLLTAGTLTATHRIHHRPRLSRGSGGLYALPTRCGSRWGVRYGNSVLKLLCRLSFEASTCVSKTEGYFTRRGPATLLFSKFVPGLSTVAAPDRRTDRDAVCAILYLGPCRLDHLGRDVSFSPDGSSAMSRRRALLSSTGSGASPLPSSFVMVLGFLAHRILKQRKFLQQVRRTPA